MTNIVICADGREDFYLEPEHIPLSQAKKEVLAELKLAIEKIESEIIMFAACSSDSSDCSGCEG